MRKTPRPSPAAGSFRSRHRSGGLNVDTILPGHRSGVRPAWNLTETQGTEGFLRVLRAPVRNLVVCVPSRRQSGTDGEDGPCGPGGENDGASARDGRGLRAFVDGASGYFGTTLFSRSVVA